MNVSDIVGIFQQVPSLDLSENMSSELAYAPVDLNGTTVHMPRPETRRNRSCRTTATTTHESHSRSHSRHRYVRARDKSNDCHDLSVMDDHDGDGKENFMVPCTPKTPRQKQRPVTVGSSPTCTYQRTPSSPPACLTTTLPVSSECCVLWETISNYYNCTVYAIIIISLSFYHTPVTSDVSVRYFHMRVIRLLHVGFLLEM